jgi:hypothetical protein
MTVSISAEEIKAALRCGKPNCKCAKGDLVHCCSHSDPVPSLSIKTGDKVPVVVRCFGNCEQDRVISQLREMNLWPEGGQDRSNGQVHSGEHPVAVYEYRTASGDLIAVKGRFEYAGGRKSFKWKLPNREKWEGLAGMPMSAIPLWGAELICKASLEDRVFLCEGEKAATACRALGLLAVTHGGGASTTDFGESLDVLRGRCVVLWPDNDEAGRRYMARVHAILRPIAKSATIVQPPVPEKGDAVEYFGGGGTVADLLRDAPPSVPTVDYLAHDSIRVRMPSSLGTVAFTFTNMEKTSRELNCELEVIVGKTAGEPYTQRLNLLSGSAVTEMRRNLDLVHGKDMGWAQVLNTAIAKSRRAFLEQDRSVRLANIPDPGPPSFLIHQLLPMGVPTVWFGTGSSCKTYLALRAAISVGMGIPFMDLPVKKQGGVMLIDYEDTAISYKFRCLRMLIGLGKAEFGDPDMIHWPARGIPLADQIEAVRTKVEREGITLVIVDSAAAACGGKPEDADIALRYFMALQKLGDGVTSLTIAHVSKGSDEMRPFGSIFWENQARRTVNFSRTDDEDTDDMDVGVYFRKVNQGKKPKPMAFHVHFDNDIGPVTMARTDVNAVPQLAAKRPVKWQAWELLSMPMSIYEIAAAMNKSEDKPFIKTLGAILGQEKKMFVRIEAGGLGKGAVTTWGRLCPEPEPVPEPSEAIPL